MLHEAPDGSLVSKGTTLRGGVANQGASQAAQLPKESYLAPCNAAGACQRRGHSRASLRAACVAVVGVTLAGASVPAPALASVVQQAASLENGTLSEFDITDVRNGAVVNKLDQGGFDRPHATKATIAVGAGGFARVIDKVAWTATETCGTALPCTCPRASRLG